jgi:ABC-type branched-subunit amino acid transport system substrate-binding protein
LGPIENDISAACAAISDYERLPIISPTATEPDLTRLTDYFYQINSTIDMRAKLLAQYALDSLDISRIATFSPLENHFIRMVETFVETIESAGAEVIAQEWYYPGDQDFSKQFMNLKRKGLKYAFSDSVLQVNQDFGQEQIDSLYKEFIKLEQEKLEEADVQVDSADIPVTTIDGIFIPIYKEDLPFIAPQVAYSNIRSQYLGNGDWYDIEQLKKNKNYINGIIFVTDGFVNEESWDFRRFRNEYRTKLKKTPTFYSIIGYDSFRYMLSAINNENNLIKREEYLNRLENIEKYIGIYRNIHMNEDRVNQNLQLLKYNYGQVIPMD